MECDDLVVVAGTGRDKQDGDLRLFTKFSAQFKTTAVFQIDIQKQQIRRVLLKELSASGHTIYGFRPDAK